jgi:hypothetical protein
MSKPRKTATPRRRTISRRKFLEGVVVSGAGLAAIAGNAHVVQAIAARGVNAQFKVLTPDEGRLLKIVLDRLVPREGTMPGAGELGVAHFVDEVLFDAPHLRRRFVALLKRIRAVDDQSMSDARRDDILRSIEQHNTSAFDLLLQITYTGYYGHPEVLSRIGWSEAGRAELFDAGLLAETVKRGPIYRDV